MGGDGTRQAGAPQVKRQSSSPEAGGQSSRHVSIASQYPGRPERTHLTPVHMPAAGSKQPPIFPHTRCRSNAQSLRTRRFAEVAQRPGRSPSCTAAFTRGAVQEAIDPRWQQSHCASTASTRAVTRGTSPGPLPQRTCARAGEVRSTRDPARTTEFRLAMRSPSVAMLLRVQGGCQSARGDVRPAIRAPVHRSDGFRLVSRAGPAAVPRQRQSRRGGVA
jgi:hypothetical protein